MSSKVISSLALLALCACGGSKESYVVGAVGPWKQGYGLQNIQGVQLYAGTDFATGDKPAAPPSSADSSGSVVAQTGSDQTCQSANPTGY